MKIMVISPHPDDETLGCGATLLKHKNKKDKIFWLNVTSAGPKSGYSYKFAKKREIEIQKVCNAYLVVNASCHLVMTQVVSQ